MLYIICIGGRGAAVPTYINTKDVRAFRVSIDGETSNFVHLVRAI